MERHGVVTRFYRALEIKSAQGRRKKRGTVKGIGIGGGEKVVQKIKRKLIL